MNLRKIKHMLYLKKELRLANIEHFFSHKKNVKIRIVSTTKWAYKCGEDVLILRELKKQGFDVKIVCYETEKVDKEAIYLIKSIWGYQDNPKKFNDFLKALEKDKVRTINPVRIMKKNIDKEEQYNLFMSYDIPHINSVFISKDKDFLMNVKKCLKKTFVGKIVVVKPSISASGNNTYVLNGTSKNNITLTELEEKFSFFTKKNKLIMQEFIPDVKDGEVSVIALNGKIAYGVRRYPSVFTQNDTVELLKNLDEEIISISKNVLSIPELRKAFYARIDLIKKDNSYLVMEIEYTDPQLFLNVGCSKEETKEHIKLYCEELIKYIEKDS